MEKKLTPMMQQFYQIKEQYPDCILFYRLGDFYEMFGEDATVSAEILDITLTSRTKSEGALPMCGVPYHSAEGYVLKLTHAGKKVAICEQVSNPRLPGLVKREVIRVITPGTNISNNYLDTKLHNHIMAVSRYKERFGVAYADISTGEFFVDEISSDELPNTLQKVRPSELILNDDLYQDPQIYQICGYYELVVTRREDQKGPLKQLLNQLDAERLEGFELDHEKDKLIILAAANLLTYLEATQKQKLRHVNKLQRLHSNRFLLLDATTIQNLELFYTQKDHDKRGSLFNVIDFTKTGAGSRMLAQWLLYPMRSLADICSRQEHVKIFVEKTPERVKVQELLKQTYDLQRLVSRLALRQGGPRDLVAIRSTLSVIPQIKAAIGALPDPVSQFLHSLPMAPVVQKLLTEGIAKNPPATINDLGIIADGYSAKIDELRDLHTHSEAVMTNFLAKEKAATGIPNLKIGNNKIAGFYLEISKGKLDLVPDHYIAKQTLTNYNRYITPELKEYEAKVMAAADQLHHLEQTLWMEIVEAVLNHQDELQEIGQHLAELDCWLSLAELATKNRYTLPLLTAENALKIEGGRHPVVEQLLPSGKFVVNDTCFTNIERVLVLTGPNMGGKSTYLRQTALITLLAHMGSYVPATNAVIPLTDRIFTRVGASDNLSKGQSTFMVEMQELAVILHNATDRSLLIIDEIGRGTSTYDGVSIAWATLEFIHNQIKANTLFATHYHELISVADELLQTANYSMAVHEEANQVTFLHQVQAGGMNDSYGIEVAKRAGVPEQVITNAQEKLLTLEEGHLAERIQQTLNPPAHPDQLDIFTTPIIAPNPIIDRLKKLNLNETTPIQALQLLAEMQREA